MSEAQRLAQSEDFDFLHSIGESYATLRRYAPAFLEVLTSRAVPAAEGLLEAIGVLRGMNAENARKLPVDASIDFIKKRWEKLIFTEDGVDRRYYEPGTMSELKNALRSGDVWVEGSRQHKDFDEYLITTEKFTALKAVGKLSLCVATACEEYLHERLYLLEQQLEKVNILASANQLPDASITDAGQKITPVDAVVPEAAQHFPRFECHVTAAQKSRDKAAPLRGGRYPLPLTLATPAFARWRSACTCRVSTRTCKSQNPKEKPP